MFEHMAFKARSRIGHHRFQAEKAALEKVDEAYHAYGPRAARSARRRPARVEALRKAWKDAQEEAGKFIKANEFGEIIDREAGSA